MNFIKKFNISYYSIALALYFVSLPTSIITIDKIGSALRIIAIIPGLVFLLSSDKKYHSITQVNNYLWLVLLILCSLLWSIDFSETWERAYSHVLFLCVLVPTVFFTYSKNDIILLKYSLILSSIITAIIVFRFGATMDGNRLYLEGVLNEDPNLLTAYFMFGIIAALEDILSKRAIIRKVISCLLLILYFRVIFLTGSRGGLVAIISGIAIYYILFNNDKATIMKKLLFVIVLYFLSNLVYLLIPDELIDRYLIDNAIESRGTHRFDIWENALELMMDSSFIRWIVGYGYNTTRKCFTINGYQIFVMHNVFFEHILELGLIGFGIYTKMVYSFVKESFKVKDMFSFSILSCMVVLSLSTNIIAFKPYWNIMLFSICYCIYYYESNNTNTPVVKHIDKETEPDSQ